MSSNPVMIATRRCPWPVRWRVAARPPAQLAEPTDGTSGSGSPAGSTMTKGMFQDRSRCLTSAGSEEKTSTTPSGRRLSTPSIQSGAGACRVPLRVSTTSVRWARAAFSTPRTSSIAQTLSSSWKTSSTSGERGRAAVRRRYPCTSRSRSTLARVVRETSERPLRTFETVGGETPASFATCARVTLAPTSTSPCMQAG